MEEIEFSNCFTQQDLYKKHQCSRFEFDQDTVKVTEKLCTLLTNEQLRALDSKLGIVDDYLGVASKAAEMVYGLDKFGRVDTSKVEDEELPVILAEGNGETYEILKMCNDSRRYTFYRALVKHNVRGTQICKLLQITGYKEGLMEAVLENRDDLLEALNQKSAQFSKDTGRSMPVAVVSEKQTKFWYGKEAAKAVIRF